MISISTSHPPHQAIIHKTHIRDSIKPQTSQLIFHIQSHKTHFSDFLKPQTPHLIFHFKQSFKPIIHNPLNLPLKELVVAMSAKKELEVVRGLDLQRYMGRWYEIASFPSRFQPKSGINTRATYTLKEDGTVNVLNETWTDGKSGSIEGTGYRADTSSDQAKLKVKFYVPPFLPIIPVIGDYWVMFIDGDYQYALIGQPSRKYLWILCRQNHMDDEIYNQLLDRAKEQGYDVSKIHKTTHTNPPPETDESPKDTKGIWWIKSIFGK